MARNNQDTNPCENLSALDLLQQLEGDLDAAKKSEQPPQQSANRQETLEKMAGEISAYITDDMDDAAMAQIIRKYLSHELPPLQPQQPVQTEETAPAEETEQADETAQDEETAPAEETVQADETAQGEETAPAEETEQADETEQDDVAAQTQQTATAEEPLSSDVYLEEEIAEYPEAILDLAAEQERKAKELAAIAEEEARKQAQLAAEQQAIEQAQKVQQAKEKAERAASALGLDELMEEQLEDSDRSYEAFMEFLAQRGEAPLTEQQTSLFAPPVQSQDAAQEDFATPTGSIQPQQDISAPPANDRSTVTGDAPSINASVAEDLERSVGEFDQQDLELMMAFGTEKDLDAEVGETEAERLREEIERRRAGTYDRMVKAKGEKSRLRARTEYVSVSQNKEMFSAYKKNYGTLLCKLAAGIVLLLLLFLYENAFWIGLKLPTALDPASFPVIHTLINYQLTLLLCALVWKQMGRGLRSALHKQPSVDSVTAFALLFATAYSVAICVLSPTTAVHLYNFPVGLTAFFNLLHEISVQKREIMAFKIVSSKKTKYAAEPLPRQDADEEIESFAQYLPDAPAMFRIRRTAFVDGFCERSDAYPAYKKVLRIIFPLMCIACVAFFAASFIMQHDVYNAINTGYIAALIVLPVCGFISFGLPIYEAAARAFAKDSAIIGEGSLAEYSDASVISFTDADVFPGRGVKVRSVKVYGENRIDHILYNAAGVFSRLGGPLADVFQMATAELGHTEHAAIRRIDDDGVEALVDGRLILIGKATFMNRYGYRIVLTDEEQTMENTYDTSVLFMAYETEMAAKMYIQYSVDADFETVLKELYRQGVCIAIKTSDPNIDDAMLAAKIHMSKYPIKTIRRRNEDPTACEICSRMNSGVVSKGSAKSLLQALALCDKVLRCIRRNTALKIIAVLLGLTVLGVLIFFGQSFTLPSAALVLYHLLFMLPMFCLAKLGVK